MTEDKKLAFETAMTRACDMARVRMSAAEYQAYMAHFGEAWDLFNAAVAEADRAPMPAKDKSYSLSLVLGFRKEG